LPAAIAFCSAVYWSSPVPALTRLTFTFGYFAWNLVTTSLRVGSQAQTVRLPPFCSAAWTSASETVVPPLPEPSPESSSEPHAARARSAAVARAAIRKGFLLMWGPFRSVIA
jgi:hypothetical protein